MPVSWTWDMESMLIDLVRARPALWSTRDPRYSKKALKRKIYRSISLDLQAAFPDRGGINTDAVWTKFNILRSSFRRELAKIESVRRDSGGNFTPKWKPFTSLLFLTENVSPVPDFLNFDAAAFCESQMPDDNMLLHVETCMSDDETLDQSGSSSNEMVYQNGTANSEVTYQSCTSSSDPSLTPPPLQHTPASPPSWHTATPPPSESTSTPPPPQHTQGTSQSVPGTSHSCISNRGFSTPTSAKSKRAASDLKPSNKKLAREEALTLLKGALAKPAKEDTPYAAGIIVREWMAQFPKEMHVSLLTKLSMFLEKTKADMCTHCAGDEADHSVAVKEECP